MKNEQPLMIVLTCVNLFIVLFALHLVNQNRFRYIESNSSSGAVDGITFLKNYHGDDMNYTEGVYDCNNFTESFIRYSEQKGVFCEVVDGFPNISMFKRDRGHRFAKCTFEPQTGEFVDYREIYPYQRVHER